MKKDDTWVDPIVEEVRRVREAHAAKFDYDLDRIVEDLMRQQEIDKANGIEYVTPKPRHRLTSPTKP
jgi:hypothetical protein